MHMSDALLSPPVAGVMFAASAVTTAYAVREVVRDKEASRKIPEMGVLAAFVFAAQMINISIPGTGSSGHLCGGILLSAVLGPSAGFLAMAAVLLVQCLLFQDGGILAYGANLWNMAFYGCFLGGGVLWRFFGRNGWTRGRIFAASIIGNIVALQLGAFSVTLETLASGITELPFGAFVLAMQPIHLAIGAIEGVITGAVLSFLFDARPELIAGPASKRTPLLSRGATVAILAATSIVVAGLLSLAASSRPDGLEWSMERAAGTAELESATPLHERAAAAQERTALLPDYNLPENGTAATGGLAGVIGTVIVGVSSAALYFVLSIRRRKPLAS
jgi:cobalt/nickel transport system permease protein